MDTIFFGRTGLQVSRMGIGGGGPSQLGQSTGSSPAESVAVIRQALEAGVNFMDTAESYRTEEIIGQAIQGLHRHRLVISTKKSTWGEQPINPADLRSSLEASLRRLGTDYVDIYNLHAVELGQYETMLSEIVPVMQQLKAEGKIRFLGITEAFHSDRGHAMLQRALQDNVWDVMMVGFNILNQSARERVFNQTIRQNIAVQVMFAVRLALSRPEILKQVVHGLVEQGQLDPAEIDLQDPLGFVLGEGGAVSIPDAAYRFCRDEPDPDAPCTHVILSGTGSPEHLRENLASMSRPPLPLETTAKLRHIFRKVDSISGQ